MARRPAMICGLLLLLAVACRPSPPTRQYPLTGQILAINADAQTLTVRHEDIPDFMPGMTMTFPVADAKEMNGRSVGELINATLEVTESLGRLRDITHTGTAAVEESANRVALVSELLQPGDQMPDAALIDQTDRRRSLAEWHGRVTVMTFVYTSCPLPNFCPLMDQHFKTLQGLLADDPSLKDRVRLISVSVDPVHDTPAVLAAHAAKRQADPAVWTWLTGDAVTVERLAGRFGVSLIRPDADSEINHNLRTAVIDSNGRIRTIYSGNDWTPSDLMTEIRTALAVP